MQIIKRQDGKNSEIETINRIKEDAPQIAYNSEGRISIRIPQYGGDILTREQLLAECRTHGTGKKACEIIADKYGMTPGSVSVKLTKQGICKQLKEERKQSEVTVITQGNENEVKIQQPETKVFKEKESELEIKSIPEIKETEPVIPPIKRHEDKKRISTLTAKAWDGKENSYIFRDGRLVISNSEGILAVADLKTLILELQELAESQEAV